MNCTKVMKIEHNPEGRVPTIADYYPCHDIVTIKKDGSCIVYDTENVDFEEFKSLDDLRLMYCLMEDDVWEGMYVEDNDLLQSIREYKQSKDIVQVLVGEH